MAAQRTVMINEVFDQFGLKPKAEQIHIISELYSKNDVLAILPTGYGKTAIYMLYPTFMDRIEPKPDGHIAIVISPLRALMKGQILAWQERGMAVGGIFPLNEMTKAEVEDIAEGRLSVILTSPEAALSQPWRGFLRGLKDRICLIVFDEAHVITTWSKQFRTAYGRVGELASLLPHCSILAMTATLPKDEIEPLFEVLSLDEKKTKVIARNPDRPEIQLVIHTERGSAETWYEFLEWIPRQIKSNQLLDRVVIFCRAKDHVFLVQEYLASALLESNDLYQGGTKKTEDLRVDIYHSDLDTRTESRVIAAIMQPSSPLKVVVATIGFGMGIDIPNIGHVIHWGVPETVVDYFQQVGRCARHLPSGCATLLNVRLPPSVKVCDEMKEFIQSLKASSIPCVREHILKSLWLPEMGEAPSKPACMCAQNCLGCPVCTCCIQCQSQCKLRQKDD